MFERRFAFYKCSPTLPTLTFAEDDWRKLGKRPSTGWRLSTRVGIALRHAIVMLVFRPIHDLEETTTMSKLLACLFAASILFSQVATAVSDCESKAVNKAGKPLAGAAKTSSIKKCEADAKGGAAKGSGCAEKAVSKDGKPLAGAAKTSFMKKCEADAKGK